MQFAFAAADTQAALSHVLRAKPAGGTIAAQDGATGRKLASAQGPGTIYALAITPNGTQIAACGENRSTGQPIRRYRDVQVRVYRIVGEWLAD